MQGAFDTKRREKYSRQFCEMSKCCSREKLDSEGKEDAEKKEKGTTAYRNYCEVTMIDIPITDLHRHTGIAALSLSEFLSNGSPFKSASWPNMNIKYSYMVFMVLCS